MRITPKTLNTTLYTVVGIKPGAANGVIESFPSISEKLAKAYAATKEAKTQLKHAVIPMLPTQAVVVLTKGNAIRVGEPTTLELAALHARANNSASQGHSGFHASVIKPKVTFA